ncbi:family 16 glycosylhydrolase [Fibrobacter succinogenes]|uniref:family 16 glycosylhydrolase n=1 Tax=Fibrobacter succinogenes TaxID=833 RepID=UPI00156597B1|nr:family 16 glycosylhydrolase [Fibrobacter succinogenes]
MNIKLILPACIALAFVACSDKDNSLSPIEQSSETVDLSSATVPVSSETVPLSSASVPVSSATVPASSEALPLSSATVPPASSASNEPPMDEIPPAADGPFDPNKKYTFYGAELTGTELFKYGRFEARMRMAATSGTVSSMFLNYDLSWKKGDEPWNEIDIEVLGKDPTKWQSNVLTREANPSINDLTSTEKIHDFNFDATKGFHLYAIVWTPEYVAWEIDSVEVRRDVIGQTHGSHADADQVKFLTEEQTLRFNLWASKTPSWTGKFTGEGLPVEQHIDYVRVYSYDPATKGFVFKWQDDFDGNSIDYSRWSEGNWEMENVMYRDLNIRVEHGLVKLRLDYEE